MKTLDLLELLFIMMWAVSESIMTSIQTESNNSWWSSPDACSIYLSVHFIFNWWETTNSIFIRLHNSGHRLCECQWFVVRVIDFSAAAVISSATVSCSILAWILIWLVKPHRWNMRRLDSNHLIYSFIHRLCFCQRHFTLNIAIWQKIHYFMDKIYFKYRLNLCCKE